MKKAARSLGTAPPVLARRRLVQEGRAELGEATEREIAQGAPSDRPGHEDQGHAPEARLFVIERSAQSRMLDDLQDVSSNSLRNLASANGNKVSYAQAESN